MAGTKTKARKPQDESPVTSGELVRLVGRAVAFKDTHPEQRHLAPILAITARILLLVDPDQRLKLLERLGNHMLTRVGPLLLAAEPKAKP